MTVSCHGRRGGLDALPVEGRIDDDALRDRVGVVLVVQLEVGVLAARRDVRQHVREIPGDVALDRLRVGVDQQLGRVEAVAVLGLVAAVDAVAVALPGPDAGEVAVPVEGRVLAQRDALLGVGLVEEAELHPLGVLGEEREVRAVAVPGRPERKRATGPDFHRGNLAAARRSAAFAPSRRLVYRYGASGQLSTVSTFQFACIGGVAGAWPKGSAPAGNGGNGTGVKKYSDSPQ